MSELNDPQRVRDEYASEEGLLGRRAAYRYADGPDAREIVFDAIRQTEGASILEVGLGPGDLASRIQSELHRCVIGLDISPRMAELSTAHGVATVVGDVEALPFRPDEFDAVVAAWMLYHVEDIEGALREITRVLRPGGSLIAVTNSSDHLAEARAAAGLPSLGNNSFPGERAREILQQYFSKVEVRDLAGTVRFPDRESLVSFIRSLQGFYGELHLPDRVSFPFVVRRHPVILVAK